MLRGMDWWTFEGADSSVASTWFGLRHARLKSCSPSTYSGFEIWVLRFRDLGASFSSFGCFVFEFWVLRFRDLGVFVFEFWVLRFRSRVLRFRDLGASCFGLRFRVLRFRNYQPFKEAINGVVIKTSQQVCFDDIFLAVNVAAFLGDICGKLQLTFQTKNKTFL